MEDKGQQVVQNFLGVRNSLPEKVKLVVVSKHEPVEVIKLVYEAGQRIFGENRVQELMDKKDRLPADIQWHFIGNLQSNKVKYIAPFISLIQSAGNDGLLDEISRQAKKNNRNIDCLLEVHIASEVTKHGYSPEAADELLTRLTA
ncbi:MAG: YggS family pyridoxal phosphate-dependent enzyme, partial [Bacteroidia bacterium]|nr:YggS family pyridoxal phosphate-dependent enzyme [Bacteroidia bacterium]